MVWVRLNSWKSEKKIGKQLKVVGKHLKSHAAAQDKLQKELLEIKESYVDKGQNADEKAVKQISNTIMKLLLLDMSVQKEIQTELQNTMKLENKELEDINKIQFSAIQAILNKFGNSLPDKEHIDEYMRDIEEIESATTKWARKASKKEYRAI